jgi:hypothetical protein
VRAPHKSSVYRSFFPDLHHPIYGDVQASAQYVDFSASNGHHWHLDSPEIGQQCQLKDVHGDRFKRRAMFRSLCASCKDGAQAARRNKPRLGQVCADAGMLVCAAPRRGRTERTYQAIIERTAAGGVAGPGREQWLPGGSTWLPLKPYIPLPIGSQRKAMVLDALVANAGVYSPDYAQAPDDRSCEVFLLIHARFISNYGTASSYETIINRCVLC